MAVPDDRASRDLRFVADRVATDRAWRFDSITDDRPADRMISRSRKESFRHSVALRPPRLLHLSNATRRRRLARPRYLGNTMTTVKLCASTILTAFADVQSELVGKAVVLTDGKAGTVESVWLDELHGLRISIRGHVGKWPISTIKMQQGRENAGPV